MVGGRDTPPSIQDGIFGYEPDEISNFEAPSTAERGRILTPGDAMRLGREVWESSTNWINSGRRARWNDSLRAFQSLHPSGSKYLSGDYRYRSQLFRPKTRSMVRRDEAATAAAFFSNEDVVSITAGDDDDPMQRASAEILKALLQYRLADGDEENTIPWFMTLVGARQDAEVMGICVGKAEWEYEERFIRTEDRPVMGPDGMPAWDEALGAVRMESVDLYQKVKDRPRADLLAAENFRFEPGCDWRNPVKSSPYLIELIPVYIQDARQFMESAHGAPPEWNRVAESALRGATDLSDDVTRRAREAGRVPGKDHDAWKPKDFDICWTRLNTMRWGGQDWVYRTLAGGGEILMPPRPIKEVWLHGSRPYVVGCVVLETHKTYPSAKVELTADLQRAANQDWNSRFDAVMLSLQPRQFVREGSGIDINDARTFMPAKVVMVNAKAGQAMSDVITWDRPPPVDGASFQEQDRINVDWDDLAGSPNAVTQASQIQQQSATGMHLMSGEASGLSEYELRLFAETFVTGMMRLFVKLEQAYETDPVILALAGKQAQLFQRFGINEITDELLNQSVTTKVNVGIGATNPAMKLKNFATGAEILGHIFGPTAAAGANFEEVAKEIFGLVGYKDGDRFFKPDFDPRIAQLQQELAKHQGKGGEDPAAKQRAIETQTQGKLAEQQMKSQSDEKIAQLEYQSKKESEDAENWRAWLGMQRELMTAGGAAPAGMEGAPQMPQQGALPAPQGMPQGGGQAMQPIHPAEHHPMILAAAQAIQRDQEHAQRFDQVNGGIQDIGTVVQGFGQMMSQMATLVHEGNQQIVQAISQGMGILAQGIQAGNEELNQTMTQALEQSAQRSDQLAVSIEQGQQAIMAALMRKKKVIRDDQGRVAGVE